MRNLLAVGIVLVLLVCATLWLCTGDGAAPTQQDAPNAAGSDAPLAAAAPVSAPAPVPVPGADAGVERTAVAVAAPERPEHTLRGRVVDAEGRPVAGVEVGLTGWGANRERTEAWAKSNPEPQKITEKLQTATDGTFLFRFWPPPPFQFALGIEGPAIARWGQRWSELEPGGTTDVGDVKLVRGSLLRGRVVDAAGATVPNVEVRIEDANRMARAPDGFERWSIERTGYDGTFTGRWALIAGEYGVLVRDHVVERPEKVMLTGEPERVIDIVLKHIEASVSLSGVVVDETGAPIRGVDVQPVGSLATTDAEGRFRVLKSADAPDPVKVSVRKRGYEPPSEPATFAWGRDDVRIVMTRGKGLSVLVVRADDGQPVEDYVLRVVPIPATINMADYFAGRGTPTTSHVNSADYEPHGKPPHEDGRATAEGFKPGPHRVFVVPGSPDLAIGIVPINISPNGAAPVTVRLVTTASRVVRVVCADNSPVPGARVQLVDPFGAPWGDRVQVFPLPRKSFSGGQQALELASSVTDANGDCTLPVPPDRPLALLLPGPGHEPLTLPSVAFPMDGPLVVTVSRGAVLRGKLGPDAALAELKRLVGEKGKLPSVSLSRSDGGRHVTFPDRLERQPVDADGSFELTGIPPGRWAVTVHYWVRSGPGSFGKQEPAGAVDLIDGQVTTIAPDLSALVRGTLEARVLHNGMPLADTPVQLVRPDGRGGWSSESWATTDAEGNLRASVRSDTYNILLLPQRGGSLVSPLFSPETATVRGGETAQQTFTIVSATMKVRLVDANGAPVANVAIGLVDAAGEQTLPLPATGADGSVEAMVAAGSFTAWIMPKRLPNLQGVTEPIRTTHDQRVGGVQLGTLVVRAGAANEFELKLPADR